MPDSLHFSSNGNIQLEPGDFLATSAFTMLAIAKKTGAAGAYEFLFANNDASWGYGTDNQDPANVAYSGFNVAPTAEFDLDGWQLIGVSKAAGAGQPLRFHVYTWDTDTWIHENGGNENDQGAVHGGGVRIAGWSSGNYFVGNILIVGVWDSALSDGAIENLIDGTQEWIDAAPDELWRLDASAATTLSPLIGSSSETSRSGTIAVDSGDAPAGWTDPAPSPGVAFDAATESVRTATTDPYTFDHTPVGTPKGVIVAAVHGTSSTDHISGVTYGGVAMQRVVRATDTTTEPGAAELWFLGAGIPTGTQTVSVDLASATGDDFHFVCITVTADAGGDTEVQDFDSISSAGTTANPSVTLNYGGRKCLSVAALYGGGASPAAFTPNANCETVHDHDLGAFYSEVIRQTTPGTSDFAIGGTASADDVAYVAAAIAEIVAVDRLPRHGFVNFQDPGLL